MTTKTDVRDDVQFYDLARGRSHQSWVLGSAVLAILLGLVLPEMSIEQQFWIVLVPVMVIGLSHGGADPMILRQLVPSRFGGLMMAVALYLTAIAGFVALIWVLPTLALLAFLLLSVWHFGYTDAYFIQNRFSQALVWLSGSLVIIGPMAGHPLQTGEMFAWLIARDPVPVGEWVRLVGSVFAGIWLGGFALITYCKWGQLSSRALAELLLLAGAMVTLPPLLAFALYFCGVHSFRHFLTIVGRKESYSEPLASMGALLRLAGPATAIAIILALLAWLLIVTLEPDASLLIEAVRVMFWALAALTLPHALVVGLWWNRGLN